VASGRYCQDELLAKAVGMQPLSWLIFVVALPLVGLATVTFSFASPLITLSLFVVLGWSLLALTCDVARSVGRIGDALHNVPHIGSAQSPEVPPHSCASARDGRRRLRLMRPPILCNASCRLFR
jgi:hypothetical protein